ncbi:MAG: ABC transporter permease [Halobacteriales archaeon]
MTDDGRPGRPGSSGASSEPDGGVGYAEAIDWRAEPAPTGRLRQVLTIAGQEYRLAVRNRWAFALTGLFAGFALLVTVFGASSVGPGRVDATLVSLAALATYLVPLAALVFGYDAIVGADEAGWLDVVFALPVPRPLIAVGTYLGRGATLAAATLLGFGTAGAAIVVLAGLVQWPLFAALLFGAVGLGLAFLAVGVFISALAAEKTHALGAVLVVWVWFAFVHDLVALAALAAVELPDAALSAAVLANPADVFRVLVLGSVETTGGGLAAAVASTSLSVPLLAIALLGWMVLPTVGAALAVRRRSL